MANNKKQADAQKFRDIVTLVCECNTNQAEDMLAKYGDGQKAKDMDDLIRKISMTFMAHPDKRGMEQQFAKLHPHRDLILRYEPKPTTPIPPAPGLPAVPQSMAPTIDVVKNVSEGATSNCNGNPTCSCGGSHFSGDQSIQSTIKAYTPIIITVLGVAGIIGAVMIYKHKN